MLHNINFVPFATLPSRMLPKLSYVCKYYRAFQLANLKIHNYLKKNV